MKWYEVIVNTTSEGTDLMADAFFSVGCEGVKILDKNDALDVVNNTSLWDYIDNDLLQADNTARVSGFFPINESKQKVEEFKKICFDRGLSVGEINIVEVEDTDWYDNWKKYYAPIHAGKYHIVPKWLHDDIPEDSVRILIDPGMAFGTGAHESTKMCLLLMSENVFTDKKVIDVGTGSGILGTAALLSGASSCYMCDIDEIAVKAAIDNAELNGVTEKAVIEQADLLEKSDMTGDIVLANLTADILEKLADGLKNHIEKGGVLICSGIIHERIEDVRTAFDKAGLMFDKMITMGEWDAMQFHKE